MLRPLDDYDGAIKHLSEALRLQPKYPEAFNTLGIVHAQLRRIEEAKQYYEKALASRPDYPKQHLNRSLLWLGEGDFARGWPEYEWRLKLPNRPQPKLPFPTWDGTPLNGRTLLLIAEQGLGDAVQFVQLRGRGPARHGWASRARLPQGVVRAGPNVPGHRPGREKGRRSAQVRCVDSALEHSLLAWHQGGDDPGTGPVFGL